MRVVGLNDADWIAYQMAAAIQKKHRWADGIWTLEADENELFRALDDRIEYLRKEIGAKKKDNFMCISGANNWRKDIMPTYKANRNSINRDISRPMLLSLALDYIRENYQVLEHSELEADDIMGVYATDPDWHGDCRKVIVSIDKDLKSIPAWHYTPDVDFSPWLQDEAEADILYRKQWLMGDRTDGYEGCNGIGEQTARKLAEDPVRLVQTEHVFKSGKRAGQSEIRWVKEPADTFKECALTHYQKAGQTQAECFQNAMVARILRHGEFDFNSNEVVFKP